MPSSVGDINVYKVSIGDLQRISKISVGEKVVYSAGNAVTYRVDTDQAYTEEVDEGESCLSPKAFTPAKSGWEFVGWRQDAYAGGNVLGSLIMGDDSITLYAVFRQTITVTYYNNSTNASTTSGYRYYNNGNVINPFFTLTQSARSGWTARGWSTSTAGNGGITYNNATAFTRDSSVTLYGCYQQPITVTYYNNSTSASTTSGTRYYNPGSGNVVNPSFTLTQAARSGWTARGWSTENAGNSEITYNNATAFMRDSNITLYGMYQQTVTVTYYNNSTTASTTSGTRYYNSNGVIVNPSFTLTQTASSGWTARGWATSNVGNATITYANGTTFTRDSNVTLYGLYQQTITVTYYNNSTTASTTTGTRYWAPAGYINPSFTLTQTARSGWTARGWSTGTAGNSGITYNNATAFTRDSNIALYGMYQQSITLTYYNGSTTAGSTSGTRYYNSGKDAVTNPTFSLTPATLSGWTFRGWAISSAAAAGIVYNSISGTAFSANTTVYAAYSQTITLSYNGNGSTGGSTASQTGTRYFNTGNYSNPSFTLSTNGFTKTDHEFQKWAMGSASGTQYAAGASITLTVSTTFYAVWEEKIAAKSAPPFLSAGWRACRVIRSWEGDKGWSLSGQIDGSYILHVSYEDLGTKYISETGIDTGIFWVENDYYQYDTYDAFLFHSSTIDASSYSYFVAGEEINLDDDASNLSREFYHISRFSNDGAAWTDWLWTNETKKSLYKYAQVGVFFGAINGDDYSAWFRFKLKELKFYP